MDVLGNPIDEKGPIKSKVAMPFIENRLHMKIVASDELLGNWYQSN